MAKSFRLLQKKRGDRRTGSRWWGSLAEALLFFALFLIGMISAVSLITLQAIHSTPEQLYISGWGLGLRVLIIAVFLAVGGGGFLRTVLQSSSSQERRSARRATSTVTAPTANREFPCVPSDINITNSPGVRLAYRLPAAQDSNWRFLVTTLVCLVSTATSCVLLLLVWKSVSRGRIDWLTAALTVPAVGVSLASGFRFIKDLTINLTVGPTSVEISAQPLTAGGQYEVFFAQGGHMFLSRLRMLLVCDEEATYREGTDIRTETCRVVEHLIFKERNVQVRPRSPCEKHADLAIPAGAMHSFQSNSNSIRWRLLVILKPRRWPVIHRTFPIIIAPDDVTAE